MKKLVLCADDFAMSEGVSKGILELVSKGRVSATSCITGSSFWSEFSKPLAIHSSSLDIGLHFVLGSKWPKAIRADMHRQLDSFESSLGRKPDFIDGHHHVHQLPWVRGILLEALFERYSSAEGIYFRATANQPALSHDGFKVSLKKYANESLGFSQRKFLEKNQVDHNDSFAGMYDYTRVRDYRDIFIQFLQINGERPLIMCHPGFSDSHLEKTDVFTEQREKEFDYLMSDEFLEDLNTSGFSLGRFKK